MDVAEVVLKFKELASEITVGAVIGLGLGLTLVGLGKGANCIRKWCKSKYGNPEREPFEGIEKVKLPQSKSELKL